MIRTRFAPSPTGYLHLGGARTALYSWAHARKHGGQFVLRIEDTDLERSTEASVQAIFDGMKWLGIDYDEGPFFQMQRMPRYKEVIQQLLDSGHAYYCYASKEELDELRARQTAAGEKPRYDRRWRDSTATPPAGVNPVVRFKNPLDGDVVIDDMIKGRVVVANSELDDFIIARSDGTPTYNFCVVVDDWDMNITHVIRGDDHLNNTPRQINVLKALGAPVPHYGHLPMIFNKEGAKMSKRHDAVSVMQYAEAGYLPEAMLNYLARLGWGHENDEMFSMAQFVEWFDVTHVSASPARFDPEKLGWLNQQYMKAMSAEVLAEKARPYFERAGLNVSQGPDLGAVVTLMRERATTLAEMARISRYFYTAPEAAEADLWAKHYPESAHAVVADFAEQLQHVNWTQEGLHDLLQATVKAHGVKFPVLAMPLRLMVCGTTQTPSIDAVLALLGRDTVQARLAPHIG